MGVWQREHGDGGSTGKTSTWEGGHREPGLAVWPGRIAAGATLHALVTHTHNFDLCHIHDIPASPTARHTPRHAGCGERGTNTHTRDTRLARRAVATREREGEREETAQERDGGARRAGPVFDGRARRWGASARATTCHFSHNAIYPSGVLRPEESKVGNYQFAVPHARLGTSSGTSQPSCSIASRGNLYGLSPPGFRAGPYRLFRLPTMV